MNEAKRIYNLLRGYIGKEWERIQSLEREAAIRELEEDSPAPAAEDLENKITIPKGSDPKDKAREILGVEKDASFSEIRRAYMKLNKRSSPNMHPSGSEAARQARTIHRKVQWAYQTLTADTPDLQKRFQSLEID